MITAPPQTTEWKLDSTPSGGVLKRIKKGEVQTQGSVVFSERFGLFLVTSFRYPHWRMEIAELEAALEILWSWRTGSTRDHHVLCECDDCEMRRGRRFGDEDNESEAEEYQWSHP